MFELGPDPPRHRAVRAFNRKHRLMAYCTGASSDIYDTHELNLLASHRHDPLAESASFNAVFSPDGRWLVKWSVTGEVLAWDWNSAAAPLTLEASDVDKALVGMAIDGNFAAGFRQSAQKIEIWNLPTGQLYSSESCAQFSADHTGLWTTAGKLGLLRWTERHTTGQVTRERPASPLKELILEVWSRFPDGARTTAHLWEGVRDEFMDATLFPDRETVVLRCRLHEHAVELFEFSLPEKAFTSRRVLSVPSFHPVAGQLEDLDIGMGRQLGFYDPLTGAKRDDWCIQAHTRPATSLKVSSGGGVLVACCDGQSLVVVDLASRTQSAEALLPTAPGPHRVLAVGDDATGQATVLLASGDVLKSVAVRDAGGATCTERELPRSGDAGRTTYWTACPGPAAPHAAFGTWGQLELLENPYSKAGPLFLHSKDGFGDWIPAFSPCGGFLSAARRNEFRMWTIDGAALHRRLFSIPQPFAVQYSPEGHTVWIADDDGTFWRIAVDALQPPANARVPAWELPRPEVLMQAWTLAQRVGSIDAGDWLPLLAAVCTAPVLSRFTYSDLGLLAPSIYV
jgi:WD40 repeat protein